MNTETPTPELNAALCKAQSEMGPARKGKVNPAFRSNYADLASVIEAVQPLHDNGLAYSQLVAVDGDIVGVRTVLRHVSGQTLDCGSMTARAKDASAQAIGSALTYLRRYSLMTACGIASADDDGNNAGRPSAPPPPRNSPVVPPPAAMTPPPSTWLPIVTDVQISEALSDLGYTLAQVNALCLSIKRPLVSNMTSEQRSKLLLWLCTDDGAAALKLANTSKE
jgi:hypothetical protein